MSKNKLAKGIEWDLTEYYKSINDPKIDDDIKKTEKWVDAFTKKYKGKIDSPDLTPELLLKIFKEDENEVTSYRYNHFAGLLSTKNILDEDISAFSQKLSEIGTKISEKLLWFLMERREWSDEKAEKLINSPVLANYKNFLIYDRVFVPHTLSEKEERLLTLFSPVGSSAFIDLYDKLDASAKFKIKIDGKTKELTYAQLPPYLSFHKDRSVRKTASESLTKGLKENTLSRTHILNTLLLSSKIADEVRGYKFPQDATFKSYEVKKETVGNMVSVIESGHEIVERYYKAKAKVLDLKKLHEWDRYSPIYPGVKKTVTWEEAKDMVLGAFYEFDKNFGDAAKLFFDNKWIDAEITPGKSAGAYCWSGIPSDHPHILMNFTGEIGDVMTLAHELGHGIHAYLGREQNLYNFGTSTVIAEIASIFAESLVFDYLYKDLDDKRLKINLLAEKIQGVFATVFRQNAFYLFETDLHTHRREQGELKVEDISSYYQARLQKMFGEGLELTEGHKYWWMPVSHFYHYDFYVFSYAFGELLTTALYAKYKKDYKKFIPNYIKALSLRGAKNPYELTKIMGVDINDKDFWKNGLKIILGYVEEFEKLVF